MIFLSMKLRLFCQGGYSVFFDKGFHIIQVFKPLFQFLTGPVPEADLQEPVGLFRRETVFDGFCRRTGCNLIGANRMGG